MGVRYNKLFKLMIDKKIKPAVLRKTASFSPNTMRKLTNNEYVSMEILVKLCKILSCDIGDIVEVVINDSATNIMPKLEQ